MKVELTPHNVFMAGMIGVSRVVKNLKRKPRFGQQFATTGWQGHCDGAIGEWALAKATGKYYDGAMDDFNAADVGRYQIRSTGLKSGSLILHSDDNDEEVFILALLHELHQLPPTVHLRGWIKAKDGKQDKYWRDGQKGRPAYFVPQSVLHDISELTELE